ncbi:YidC/Oxa1 family membrane protein insertase [Streptobacillus felis]|uniref:Membrane protein insertase YidC n=1 Tax=Streptobacillus felis TaxID=1384509 RepID=A0A7Z0PGI8_9FUSO|nr:YidC/Oxa1 family membrane protein insertase [Streptobacillus felis]NYV27640.1 membrane protein insertase YidC [Streptobacillus felis]
MTLGIFLAPQWLVNAAVKLLSLIYSVVGNYGIAIIITTFLVRLILMPLTLKQEKSMKRMREIQPKIDALKEKYKDDKQMLNQKTMELYQKEQVNPAGGCLPILIQLPVFIALYQAFITNALPQDATFLWFNLSKPDSLFTIGGFSVNLLPLLTTGLTFIQQKLMQAKTQNTNSDDPMASSMQTMMYVMPIMMLFIFYKMPSGLNLYYFVNTLLSVLQQFYVMNRRDM